MSNTDTSLLKDLISEMSSLNDDILVILKNLSADINQPAEFLKFSQIIDRIYGTAMTMGLTELGNYAGALKNISRKCGNTAIPRSQKPVLTLMLNYINHFTLLTESIEYPEKRSALNAALNLDLKRMQRLEAEVFEFADKKCSMISLKPAK